MIHPRIAVLIPALNEEQTIVAVVRAFRAELPGARIVVFDNNSTDGTAAAALTAGAEVFVERRRGKGNVVQSMFRSVDADVCVMVDGDATYPAARVHDLIAPVLAGTADMVIGSRLQSDESQFRLLNRLGNVFYAQLLRWLFNVRLTDLLSGYRAFSRELVQSLPLIGGGFETEAEMTIKAVHRSYRVLEVPVSLVPRPEGSRSHIRIVQDGLLILNAIVSLFRDYKPLTFFSVIAIAIAAASGTALLFAFPVAAVVLAALSCVTLATGAILHTVARHFQELEVQLLRATRVTNNPTNALRLTGPQPHSRTVSPPPAREARETRAREAVP